MAQLVQVAVPPLPQLLTYRVPAQIEQTPPLGQRVNVPLGRRITSGFVIGTDCEETVEATRTFELKDLLSVEGQYPCFNSEQLEFFKWVAEYYGDSLSNVIDVAVPPRARQKFRRFIILKNAAATPKGKLQEKILAFAKETNGPLDCALVARRFKGSSNAIKALVEHGTIEVLSEELIDQHLRAEPVQAWARTEVSLNEHQAKALAAIREAIDGKSYQPYLLHGVTGSGKTEVYIEAVEAAVAAGRGALIIVPEIALTPQLIERFRARLGDEIAILHSALNKRARWDSWRALLEGRNRIAIGARSGIFAPVQNLGLIIVDEEHETSYKQSDGLRYHARDLAMVRARMQSCPVVLGSATPSLESFFHAHEKRYRLLTLPGRHAANQRLIFDLVDLNKIKPWEMISKNVSPALHQALVRTIDQNEQAFILYNRRGFASYLQCEKCEFTCKCPNCSVTLTYHQTKHSLVCHYCSYTMLPPRFCPECSAKHTGGDTPPPELVQRGAGTEKIFEEIRELFPRTAVERLDRDSASSIEEYEAVLDRVRRKETQILVGTQLIAKGHDIPGVTMVGIADCDVGLHMPDFRAAERVYQLLTQAAGRAGRGAAQGYVVMQTRLPEHISLTMTAKHDYRGFAARELAQRKNLCYPPFTRLLRITASSVAQELPLQSLRELRAAAEQMNKPGKTELSILGPAPAPLNRLKGLWRFHLLIKCASASELNRVLRNLKERVARNQKVRFGFDIDPQEML